MINKNASEVMLAFSCFRSVQAVRSRTSALLFILLHAAKLVNFASEVKTEISTKLF